MSDASRNHSSQPLPVVLTVTALLALIAWLDILTLTNAGQFWELLYVLQEGTFIGFSLYFLLFHMLLKLSRKPLLMALEHESPAELFSRTS